MFTSENSFKRFYFITSFAVILFITVGMGAYLVNNKYRELRLYALIDKNTHIENKKTILKGVVDNFILNIDYSIEISVKDFEDRIKNRVYAAYKITDKIYKDMGSHGDRHVLEGIKAALSSMVFGENYVFIFDTKGNIVSSPLMPHIEGKNMLDQKDAGGSYPVRDALKIVSEKGEGFLETAWQRPGDDPAQLRKKKVYVKIFEPFDWIIGYGEYKDDFDNELKSGIIKQLESVVYENNGYLFASTYEGISLTKPAKNKNVYDVRDVNGKYIVRELIATAKSGGGFSEYVMPPFKGARPERKLSYVAPVPQWGWYIGAGMYLTDIDAAYHERLDSLLKYAKKEAILVSLAIIVVLVIGGITIFYFSGKLQRLIDGHSKEIQSKNMELEELNLSLEDKVREKVFELYKLNHSLEERINQEVEKNREKDRIMFQQGRLAAMGEMIGNIAHQWRQPLSSISLMVQDIQEAFDCGELDEAYLNDSVSKCTYMINHMSETIDNFRNFFNPDKENIPFCINSEVMKSLNLLGAGLENNGITYEIENEGNVRTLGVPGEFAQVLVNIINNAKDALLSREIEHPHLVIEVKGQDDASVVKICDNAGGIEPEIIEKIFDPYFTTKDQGKGTGIGLYFSKMIIEENMKGSLTVENTEEGACFIVSVPKA